MANNNKQQSEINLLKASFCRQHFPDLMQFLRKFDISSTFNEKGEEENFKDDLSMHFLIQAYDNRNETIPQRNTKQNETEEAYNKRVEESHAEYLKINRELKSNCKWCFPNIKETDVILAINEYFEIISTREDLIELTKVLIKNINDKDNIKENLKQILTHQEDDNNQYQIEDNTTLTLLQYFGIKTPNTNLGKQRDDFARFILHSTGLATLGNDYNPSKKTFPEKHCEYNPQVRFIQAFELLACVRNWYGHEFVFSKLSPDSIVTLCRFIIFTHIGVTYICRNLWNDENIASKLTERGNIRPKNFLLEDITFEVNIKGINRTDIISECDLEGASSDDICNTPSNSVTFHVAAKMYQLFKIKFKCNNDSYKVLGKLNYYSWEPILNIVVKPPKDVSYIFKGLANDNDLEEYLGKLFGKYMEIYTDPKATNEQKEQNEEILKKIGDLETQFLKLQGIIEHENEKAITEMKETIRQKLFNISENQDEILKKLDEIQDTITGTRDIVTNTGEKIDEEIRKREEERKKREKNRKKLFKNLIVTFFFLLACIVSFCSFSDNISTNLLWLKCRIWYFIAALIITGVVSWLLWKLRKGIGEKTKWDYGIVGVAALILFGSPFLFKYQNPSSLAVNYDFAANNNEQNQVVASFLEERLKSIEDHSVMTKLLSYYLLYNNNSEKVNMLWSKIGGDANRYPEVVMKAAELFLEVGDYTRVKNALTICPQQYRDSSVVAMRLNGIMIAGGYGVNKDLMKGVELLDSASGKGDLEATYWLGHIASSIDFQEWKETDNQMNTNMRYNILLAIRQLREACELPKAAIELGNLYADLNMNDSAEYYYLKVLSKDKNCLEANYQLGRLYDKIGKEDPTYMQKAIANNYAPALLYLAERDSDHISAIELYKIFDDSVKVRRYDKKYREDYRYIRPIVFEYIAENKLASKPQNYNGLDSALNYLQKTRAEGKFNMDFVKGIEASTSTDSLIKQSCWDWFRKSADKGCLYAKMMCFFKEINEMGQISPQGKQVPINVETLDLMMDSLEIIGNDIPFANVLVSVLYRTKISQALNLSEIYAHKALIRGHLGGVIALSNNANSYFGFIKKIIPFQTPESREPVVFNDITKADLHIAKGYWISTQLALRYLPVPENKMGYITLGYDLTRIIDYAYRTEDSEESEESFRFWCDMAIANHDYLNECNLLMPLVRKLYQKGWLNNIDASYTKRLIDAATMDMSKKPKKGYREFLTTVTKLYERIIGRYNHPNDSSSINFISEIRFAGWPAFHGKYFEQDLLKECSDCFSPYFLREFKTRLKNLPKEQIKDFFGDDIYQ